MKKRPKRKRKKRTIFKFSLYIMMIYLFIQIIMNYFNNMKLVTNNEDFIRALIINSDYHLNYEKKAKNLITILTKIFTNFDLNNPITILEKNIILNNQEKVMGNNSDGEISIEELEKVSFHINNPSLDIIKKPKVYIYNSHQLENYSNKNLEIYNITPNVMMASYLLKEKLNKINLSTIVEDANIIEFMKINNWGHMDSYKASRFYIIDVMNKYKSLELFIDLHRDALTKKDATTVINNKKYAKVLFVVGLENPQYKANLKLAQRFHQSIQKKYPSLSRGVLKKQGKGVDGIYNQDLSPNMILLELGGQHNTIDEVLNTVEVMADIIKDISGDS